MAVFADAHHHDIRRIRRQKVGILGSGFLHGRLAIDAVDAAQRHQIKQVLPQEIAEALGCRGRQADILVHMVGVDPLPGDQRIFRKALQHLILGRRGGEDHVDGLFFSQQRQNPIPDVDSGGSAHLGTGFENFHFQRVIFHASTSRKFSTASAKAVC